MTFITTQLSVPQATTVINATITFIQLTVPLSLVILLMYFMPKTNTGITWTSISKTLHSSIWPTILRTDSSKTSGVIVTSLSHLMTFTTILIAVAGVVLPLGLRDGPPIASNYRQVKARYVRDTVSALGLATTPDRGTFIYGRQCVGAPCPGNGDNPNITTIAPYILETFNSTPHSPFSMQYRQFFDGDSQQNCSVGFMGIGQTLLLRNDTFATEGLIVDMSPEHPGIGFWNQTLPDIPGGGTWSQDVLWLEPVTRCVDTNLTIDYFMSGDPDRAIEDFDLTDQGGFTGLTRELPSVDHQGQQVDLARHAYAGGVYSNLVAMQYVNTSRESSSIGTPYQLNLTNSGSSALIRSVGQLMSIPVSYLNPDLVLTTSAFCQGYNDTDIANIANVHIDCAVFLGPPLRADNGDPRIFSDGSRWRQTLHSCASSTRASIQRVTFWMNSTTDIRNLRISRQKINSTVLWAVENSNLPIVAFNPYWGRVDDRFENDSSLSTIRSNVLYLPAGRSSYEEQFPVGLPSSSHAHAWDFIYASVFSNHGFAAYVGQSDYAITTKLQSFIQKNPTTGHAQIRNLMWTDVMANNVVGTQMNSTLWAAGNLRTISYDFKYGIPGFILVAIWLPSFFVAVFLLLARFLTFEYTRNVFNHLSIGRIVVGASALRVQGREEGKSLGANEVTEPPTSQPNPSNTSIVDMSNASGLQDPIPEKKDQETNTGDLLVILELDHRGSYEGIKSPQS